MNLIGCGGCTSLYVNASDDMGSPYDPPQRVLDQIPADMPTPYVGDGWDTVFMGGM